MIEKDKVIALHEVLEELSVCREGIHNPAQLDSAIAGQQWYDDSVEMYIHVAYNIDAYHIFKDGIIQRQMSLLNSNWYIKVFVGKIMLLRCLHQMFVLSLELVVLYSKSC